MAIHIAGTNQEVFDRVCAHLAQQGTKAHNGRACQYRTGEGHKCAIGGLLSDEDCATLDALDDSNIFGIIRRGIATSEAEPELLSDLQTDHDDSKNADHLRGRLYQTAWNYSLNAAAADQITHWNT